MWCRGRGVSQTPAGFRITCRGCWTPLPRFQFSRFGLGPESLYFSRFPGDADIIAWEPHLENHHYSEEMWVWGWQAFQTELGQVERGMKIHGQCFSPSHVPASLVLLFLLLVPLTSFAFFSHHHEWIKIMATLG
jgi:hypothetical protein